MEKLSTQELVENARPYLELQSDLLNNIATGMRKLIADADVAAADMSDLIRIATYKAQIIDIERELIQRN
jgi:hypothetical protein